MKSASYEIVSPNSFDAHFGQITKTTKAMYGCAWCGITSDSYMKVNAYGWNKFPERRFCSSRCADKWADECYEKGIHVSWAGEERIDYDLDERVKFVYQYQELNQNEYLEVAFWLRNLFTQYDVAKQHIGREWKIDTAYNKLEYVEFIEKLQKGKAFDLQKKSELLDFVNKLSSLFYWNSISLRWELMEEYRKKNELQHCGCPVYGAEKHQLGCSEYEVTV